MLKKLCIFTDTQIQVIAGALTKSMQTILANPIIIIKTRLEVVGFNEYTGMIDATR